MSMKDTIQDALDDISSPSSSFSRRSQALAVLEQQLALACAPDVEDDTMRNFLELQHTFECNVPSRTFSWIQVAASQVEALAGKAASDKDRETELNALCSQLCQLLSIIQGIALHHTASKAYLGRRYPLETLVALLTRSRHTSMIIPSSAGSSIAGASLNKPSSVAHLSSAILDTLLCVLVDSSPALRTFEQVNGVQTVVKLLKRAGTPREVRMKCLEFLYFYLMDETAHHASPLVAHSTPSTPMRTAGPKIFPRASSASFISSASTTASAFTVATKESMRTPSQKSYSTPAEGGKAMRTVDVDYEPQSPKKAGGWFGTARGDVRTTDEKKEMLGTMLGNVDALVEGVRQAGIWGLTWHDVVG